MIATIEREDDELSFFSEIDRLFVLLFLFVMWRGEAEREKAWLSVSARSEMAGASNDVG